MSIKKYLLSITCGVCMTVLAGIITKVFYFDNLDCVLAGWFSAILWTGVHNYIKEA